MNRLSLPIAAALLTTALLAMSSVSAFAQAGYTVATTNGSAATLTTTATTFSFTDPEDTIFGFGPGGSNLTGTLEISGDYAGEAAGNVYASLITGSGTVDLITDGGGDYINVDGPPDDVPAAFVGADDTTGAILTYTTTSLVDTSTPGDFTFSSGGGSYTPAPETSTIATFTALLAAGGLLVFAKRRTIAS